VWSAQVYDAIHLLADAMQKAGTTVPAQVAEALRQTRDWSGVTGLHSFDAAGDVSGKPIVLMKMEAGQFVYFYNFSKP
jgi:branched-chain amino acid transport system substrate-binding protein